MKAIPIVSLAPAHGPPTPDGCPKCGHKHSPARGCGRHRKKATHCKRGHALEENNLYVHPTSGHRQCIVCRRLHDAKRWDRHHNRRQGHANSDAWRT